MIGTVYGRVGEKVNLAGYADDFEHLITCVQFSLNGGRTWTDYAIEGIDAERLLTWEFAFTPEQAGNYELLVRSQNDLGEVSPEAARVSLCIE